MVNIKKIIRESLINEVGFGDAGFDSILTKPNDTPEEINLGHDDDNDTITTDPSKGIVSPSKKTISYFFTLALKSDKTDMSRSRKIRYSLIIELCVLFCFKFKLFSCS